MSEHIPAEHRYTKARRVAVGWQLLVTGEWITVTKLVPKYTGLEFQLRDGSTVTHGLNHQVIACPAPIRVRSALTPTTATQGERIRVSFSGHVHTYAYIAADHPTAQDGHRAAVANALGCYSEDVTMVRTHPTGWNWEVRL